MGYVKGSNVYNVLIPGRLNILWASVGATVTCEGKLRRNAYMYQTYGKTLKSITDDVLYPDAWKISIDIKDLTPNNFNTYINYFVHGFEGSTNILASTQNTDGNSLAAKDSISVIADFMGGTTTDKAELKKQQEAINSLNRNQVKKIVGTFVSQEDIETQKRTAEVDKMLRTIL